MSPRDLDQPITIQRGTPTADDYGGETIVWATLSQEFAQVFYGRGDERRLAAVEQGQQAATFKVYSNESTRTVILRDRISHNGSFWDIEGVSPMDAQFIEFAAVRAL